MVSSTRLTLQDFLRLVYFHTNPWLKAKSAEQYLVTVRLLDSWAGRTVTVPELSAELILDFLRFRRLTKSSRTTNNNRAHLLCLYRSAIPDHHPGPFPERVIKKLPEIKPLVTAWSVEQFSQILKAAEFSRTLKNSWTPMHWRAMLLVSWDTALRLDSLLSARFEDLSDLGFLTIHKTKETREVCHKLHPQTVEAISKLPRTESGLIFDWPFNRRQIWLEFKQLLRSVDPPLPCTRRDLFHKLRRTAATQQRTVSRYRPRRIA